MHAYFSWTWEILLDKELTKEREKMAKADKKSTEADEKAIKKINDEKKKAMKKCKTDDEKNTCEEKFAEKIKKYQDNREKQKEKTKKAFDKKYEYKFATFKTKVLENSGQKLLETILTPEHYEDKWLLVLRDMIDKEKISEVMTEF